MGGNTGRTGAQLFGHSWEKGNAMLVYEHNDQDTLLAQERDFIPDPGGRFMLYPDQKRNSVLASGAQQLSDKTSLSFDAYYAERSFVQDA